VARVKKVAVVVQDGAEPFGLGAMCEVWAEPYHAEDDNPVFDFVVATPRPGRVRGASGYDLHVEHGLDAAADADLVCVTPKRAFREPSPEVVELIRDAHDRGAHVFAHCTAAFVLGEAGLLDGRRATTHWEYCDDLQRRHPAVAVERDPIFVVDGPVRTSAGVTAGMDLALALVEEDLGPRVALEVARWLVLFVKRPGGQAQFSAQLAAQSAQREPLRELQAWMADHLADDLSVPALAVRARMSERNFARAFKAETGMTPAVYVEALRVERARMLLEDGAESLEAVARATGFASPEVLRRAFHRRVGVSPAAYRERFRLAA
jgi:transcriptional regulator GlxA family with amidase domain